MARGYGAKKKTLITYEGDNLGMRLGSAAVKANIPMAYLAWVLNINRITIYGWFNGGNIRKDLQGSATKLANILEYDLAQGLRLPARSLKHARTYVEELTGEPFPSKAQEGAN